MMINTQRRHALLASLYFLIATLLTAYFIANKFWLYRSITDMWLSGTIAGSKWLIQIIAAVIFLKENKWSWIKQMGAVCLVGAILLFTYYLFPYLHLPMSGFAQFLLAIALSIGVMILLYHRAVKKMGMSLSWFWTWIASLAVAIVLQAVIFL